MQRCPHLATEPLRTMFFASKHGTELDTANVRRAFRVILKRTDLNEDG
jgi:hypothetical protein